MAYNNNGGSYPQKSNYGGSNNYGKQEDAAFMVPEEGKKGKFWKGYCDLGGGKALRLVMFEQNKPGTKSEFVVKIIRKTYDQRRTEQRRAW